MLGATPACMPGGDRAVCQSAPVCHDQKAPPQQRARVLQLTGAIDGAPLERLHEPKATDTLNSDSTRRPTSDMSGGPEGAKRPLARPLDGVVRRLH